jgi:hypothetical protein
MATSDAVARARWVTVLLVLLAGCNAILGNDAWVLEGSNPIPMTDGGSSSEDTGSEGPEAARIDGPFDASSSPDAPTSMADARDSGSGFDPCLVLPDPGAQSCTINPGATNCPNYGGCLIAFHSGNTGLCQECVQGNCAGNLHAQCSGPDDCSDLFECYCGQCENYCILDSGECQPYCVNVGNDTWGICLAP